MCYVLTGADAYLKEQAEKMFRETVAVADMNINCFEGAVNPDAVMSAVMTEPLLSDSRLVILKDCVGKLDSLLGFIENAGNRPDGRTTILVSGAENLDIIKELRDTAEIIDCSPMPRHLLSRWIQRECPDISEEACELLILYTGGLMTRINGEARKLCAYAEGRPVTVADVEALVPRDEEYKLYEFTEMLAKRQADRSLSALAELRAESDDVRIISGIYGHFRRLLYASVSRAGENELAAQLGVKPGALKYIKAQAGLYSPRRLKKITDRLHDADYSVKNGTAAARESLYGTVLRILNDNGTN